MNLWPSCSCENGKLRGAMDFRTRSFTKASTTHQSVPASIPARNMRRAASWFGAASVASNPYSVTLQHKARSLFTNGYALPLVCLPTRLVAPPSLPLTRFVHPSSSASSGICPQLDRLPTQHPLVVLLGTALPRLSMPRVKASERAREEVSV